MYYQHPPALPPNHIRRQTLLNRIADSLLQATIDPDKYGTTLTITGAGGFGKSSIAISLCYHQQVNQHFTDGFLFIELGPQAADPNVKLKAIHKSLTNKDCDLNVAEHKIKQLTVDCCHNLLVIIDDVWHIEDAEPLLRAFCNNKTIITTRMNDIDQFIPSISSVTVSSMTQEEAIFLLTSGVVDSSKLSQEERELLYKLAQDVHLWPLPLSLIRGLLSHSLKQSHLSCYQAIKSIQDDLYHHGIVAFDESNAEDENGNRRFAANACIEVTLKLVPKHLADKYKSLILWTGIGTSLQTVVLNNLWDVSKQEAENTVDALWGYGLVRFTDITISPNSSTQQCVEVHEVISQYIIEGMDSKEFISLSPLRGLKTAELVKVGLKRAFQHSYGIPDLSVLSPTDYLEYILSETENVLLPFYIKSINNHVVTDPHEIILTLQEIKDDLMSSPYTVNVWPLFSEEVDPVIADCRELLKDASAQCRKVSQIVQRNFYDKDFDKLIQTVEEFIRKYHLCRIARSAAAVVEKITLYCEGGMLEYLKIKCEKLQLMTPDYHFIATMILPIIKLFIKNHKNIIASLLKGSPHVEQTYYYIISNKCNEEFELVDFNYFIKVQEIAPILVALESKNTGDPSEDSKPLLPAFQYEDPTEVISDPSLPTLQSENANNRREAISKPVSTSSNSGNTQTSTMLQSLNVPTRPTGVHDVIGSNLSEINTYSEINQTLHPQSGYIRSNTRPGICA